MTKQIPHTIRFFIAGSLRMGLGDRGPEDPAVLRDGLDPHPEQSLYRDVKTKMTSHRPAPMLVRKPEGVQIDVRGS